MKPLRSQPQVSLHVGCISQGQEHPGTRPDLQADQAAAAPAYLGGRLGVTIAMNNREL